MPQKIKLAWHPKGSGCVTQNGGAGELAPSHPPWGARKALEKPASVDEGYVAENVRLVRALVTWTLGWLGKKNTRKPKATAPHTKDRND